MMLFRRNRSNQPLYVLAPVGAPWPSSPLTPRRIAAPGAATAPTPTPTAVAPPAPINWLRWAGRVILGFVVVMAILGTLVALQGGGGR